MKQGNDALYWRLNWGAATLAALTFTQVGCCNSKHESTDAASPVVSVAVSTSVSVGLPPDPQLRISGVGQIPTYEAKLDKDKAYAGLWTDEARKTERELFVSALSEAIAHMDNKGTTTCSTPIFDGLAKRKLDDAMKNAVAILGVYGTFPDDTEIGKQVRTFIVSVKHRSNHGLWRKTDGDQPSYNAAALAAVIHRNDPVYFREFIAAQRAVGRWGHIADPHRPYLTREKAALEWLALMTSLTPEEQARLRELSKSSLADAPIESVSLRQMLSEYDDNEVRADNAYKGKAVEFTGTVSDVKKDAFGSIFVLVGTGKRYESPLGHCSFADRFAGDVAQLSKGDSVTIRGRVQGLVLANVVIRDAELIE